jgi:Double zinc ribbon
MASTTCAGCGNANHDGSSFCSACGANLAPQIHCPSCNTMNPLGQRFCTRCGGSLESVGWGVPSEPGAVVDGVWERNGEELIRRVDPEDARRFLGTRTVRVPAGSVGIVLVDGVVERVLPPGERTSTSLLQRISNFFVSRDRTAFYLVDQRPFSIPFVVNTRPSASGQSLKSQVLVTLVLPKGDRAALASFIANVMRDRPSVSTGDLYNLLRPEVARIAQEVLERAAGHGQISYADAEVELRTQLGNSAGQRYGLSADVTLAPLTAVASLTLQLGTGAAPARGTCDRCQAQLPASVRFCEQCGAHQPIGAARDVTNDVTSDATTPLFTADAQQIELDLVVRVQGQHPEFTPQRVAPALVAAAGAHLRTIRFAALLAPGGFAGFEQAMAAPVAGALHGLGMTLVALTAIDVRSKTGQWLVGARADLERAEEQVRLGLSWLEQRDHELDLEQLTITRVLRQQQQRRDQAFAHDDAAVADRERRDDLASRQAGLEVATIARAATTTAARDAAEHARQRSEVTATIVLRTTQLEAELAELRARRDLDFTEVERRRRLELELIAVAEQQQLEKLRQMAQLDRETAALDHAQQLEKRAGLRGLTPDEMIAMQAGELARSQGGGAAWAGVLAARADLERRHAVETRTVYEQAMLAMTEVAKSRAEAAPLVAASLVSTPVLMATQSRSCASCGVAVKVDARFCSGCGAAS